MSLHGFLRRWASAKRIRHTTRPGMGAAPMTRQAETWTPQSHCMYPCEMKTVLQELIAQLTLERIEENLFRGQSQDLGWGVVFGGQVLGQALWAAARTVKPGRHVHSLHAYFLRPGDVSQPIVYDVDRIRDGGTFTTRRVMAIQHGHAIFSVSVSFHDAESGFGHQTTMPTAPAPESVPTEQERLRRFDETLPEPLLRRALGPRPFEHRPIHFEDDPLAPSRQAPERLVWLRATEALPDDPILHACLLAYASDHSFLTTALRPHGVSWITPGMQVASLDHSMWFHAPYRLDTWLLYAMESPAAAGARALVRGQLFTQDGQLVVSTAQEGLIRQRTIV